MLSAAALFIGMPLRFIMMSAVPMELQGTVVTAGTTITSILTALMYQAILVTTPPLGEHGGRFPPADFPAKEIYHNKPSQAVLKIYYDMPL